MHYWPEFNPTVDKNTRRLGALFVTLTELGFVTLIFRLASWTLFFETHPREKSSLSVLRVSLTPAIAPEHRGGVPWNIFQARHKQASTPKVIQHFRGEFLFPVHGTKR